MLYINYFYEDIDFFFYEYRKMSRFLHNIFMNEFLNFNMNYLNSSFVKSNFWILKKKNKIKFKIINLNFIFCSDFYLNKKNIIYLNHNKLTDIITFDNSIFCNFLEGDIYISINRIQKNSFYYNFNNLLKEIFKIFVHGLLHLFGYQDNFFFLKKKISTQESKYLF